MSFTPSEHESMLRRAHEAVDLRDRTRARTQRIAMACAFAMIAGAAALIAWPRSSGTAGPDVPQIVDRPEVPLPVERDPFVPPTWLLPPTKQLVATLPSWVEIIDSDEELEAGLSAAGQCAHVVRVDNKVLMLACSDLAPLPQVPAP